MSIITAVKHTQSAGGVVLNKNREVLVVNQKGTSWSLPKGHIDDGEDELTAAKREIYEESGITHLELIKKLGSYQRHRIGLDADDRKELKTITMFLFKTDQEHLKPIDSDNPIAIWVKKNKVTDLLTHRKDKEFFHSIIGILSTVFDE
ncbi:MAG: NUDIX domain-containing protein [Promethearchaeota archaeon]